METCRVRSRSRGAESRHEVVTAIRDTGKLESDAKTRLETALDEFAKIFQPTAAKGPLGAAESAAA